MLRVFTFVFILTAANLGLGQCYVPSQHSCEDVVGSPSAGCVTKSCWDTHFYSGGFWIYECAEETGRVVTENDVWLKAPAVANEPGWTNWVLGQSHLCSYVQTCGCENSEYPDMAFPCHWTDAGQEMSVLDSTPIGDSNCVGPGTGGGGPG